MKRFPRSPLHSSVFALLATALAVLLAVVFGPYLAAEDFLLFVGAIWLSAWFHGREGGITATVLSAGVFFLYFFVSGVNHDPVPLRLLRILSFVILALVVTWLTSAWQDSRRLLVSTLSSIGDAVLATDSEGRINFINPVAETLTGWPAHSARGKQVKEVIRLIDARSREPIENPLTRALRERVMVTVPESPLLLSRGGSEIPIEHTAAPIREDWGEVRGGILVFRDISKRRQLEEQVTHAQKMEAVGRLAGGVAGDFNNVLTVISGYAELLRAEIPANHQLRRFVEEIIYAGERAAALTRHLLAFSRGPAAQPRILDLNAILSDLEPMLQRLLGQSIELVLLPSPHLGRIAADSAQIEQVIINFATNARDAMPEGGKFVIESENIELDTASGRKLDLPPGPYVLLAISDTGTGMDAETRSRLFEPFFTTKDPGKGSGGLGLATVYGIVKQCGGQITVYSQPGCGTIFEMYLPRAAEAGEPAQKKLSPKGSETILLVDDEDGVRQLVSAVLKSNGYDVLEAGNASAALATYEKNGHKIDMVLTDVVMPQMNGFELGRQLATRAPSLKILYMSGYRDNPGEAAAETPRAFLHKPFTPDVLLTKVREVLDAA
ncbi:MAG TPA: response regulator [Bryobacteraceae bacterium]|nr:response regulator [Bryobacteraceae bacterium]